uniref:ubiquitin carboxyl-terminal hydrolase 31-like n=1 Tax=Myxine glutinosa TaxID=7769 RepID=UPI00358F7DBD
MGEDIEHQLYANLEANKFVIQLDESMDIAQKALILIFVRYRHGDDFMEDLLACDELQTKTTAAEIFAVINKHIALHSLRWEDGFWTVGFWTVGFWTVIRRLLDQCVGVCTDGAASMTGRRSGVIKLIQDVAPEASWTHCFLHREALVVKEMSPGLAEVMDIAVKTINHLRKSALIRGCLQSCVRSKMQNTPRCRILQLFAGSPEEMLWLPTSVSIISPWLCLFLPSIAFSPNRVYFHQLCACVQTAAYCKNSLDGQWYSFDDSSVEPVPEESVCARSAYILFYQRRSSIPTWSASSSLAGSTCSFLSEHWVNRIPGFERRPSLTSKASTNGTSLPSPHDSPIASQDPLPPNDEDGGFASRPFVRGVQNAEEIPTNLHAPSHQPSVGAASTNGSITPIPCPRQSREPAAAVRAQSRASETRSPTVTAVSTPKNREQKDRVTEARASSRIRAGKEARECSGGGPTVGSVADSKVMPRRGWRTTTNTRGRSSTSSEDAIPPRTSTARTKRPASATGTDIRSSRINHAPEPNPRPSSATPVAAPRRSCAKTEPHTSSTLSRVKEAQLTQKRTLPTPSQRSQVDKTTKKPVAGSTARPKPEPRASTKKQSSFVAPRQLGKWMEPRDKQLQSSTGSNGSKPVEAASKPVKEESGTKRSDGGRLTLIKSLWRDSKRASESRMTPQTARRTASGRKETPLPGPRRPKLPDGEAGKGLVVDKGKRGSTKKDVGQRQTSLGKTACNTESMERVKHESIRGGQQKERDRRTSIGPGWPGRRKNTVPESSL